MKGNQHDFEDILEVLMEIKEDETIPKNTKVRINSAMTILENCSDVKLTINKAVHEIDGMVEDPNLPIYIKTQLWNIVSILESRI